MAKLTSYAQFRTGELLLFLSSQCPTVPLTVRQVMQDVIHCLAAALAGLTITSIIAPVLLVLLAPFAWAFDAIRRRYIATSREIKRLDSLALSPILSTFSETLQVWPALGPLFMLPIASMILLWLSAQGLLS